MNPKIFKYLKLKAELSADDLKQAESLAAMTETDKQALLEFWGVGVKVAKPVARRVIEKCATEGCSLTRRARVHKDTNVDGYHVFSDPYGARKSARAESLAGAIKKKFGDKEPRCVVCFEVRDHTEHDVANGGHEFTTDLAGRVNAVLDKSPPPPPDDDEERCTATREGGRICNLLLDHNVHQMKTAMGYHEFVGSETAVGVGG